MATNHTSENVVTPVQHSKETGIRPQMYFMWIRNGKLPSHKCVCGHTYLLRDEVESFFVKREADKAEKAAAKEAEAVEAEAESA